MRRLLAAMLCTVAIAAAGQHALRRGKPRAQVQPAERVAAAVADTCVPMQGAVAVSGFDKTLRSMRESFFITNNAADSATLVWLRLTIDYRDGAGRQLHRRSVRLRCDVPAGQTRRADITAWDRQNVYYYKKSEPGRRVIAAAAPFDVAIRVDSAAYTVGACGELRVKN